MCKEVRKEIFCKSQILNFSLYRRVYKKIDVSIYTGIKHVMITGFSNQLKPRKSGKEKCALRD